MTIDFWITSNVSDKLDYNDNTIDIFVENISFKILCI